MKAVSSEESANAPIEPDGLEGRLVGGRYLVERLLGEGGMGAVYEAHHQLIDKRVVIKVLHEDMTKEPEIVERFRREARAATAIGNEHIVDVTDMGELPDGSPFIVMELLEGQALADVIEDGGPMTVARAVDITTQLCDALGAAHAKGIVHRDLKPDNVFLLQRKGADFVKVLDFGISKMKEIPGLQGSLTKTGMAMGTPTYMAPEQAQGLKSVDHRADIYAVGVILFEMLTGELPFDGETYPALLLKVMTETPPVLTELRADVPPGLAQVVHLMLAKTAQERPTTMQDVAAALAPYRSIDLEPSMMGAPASRRSESISGVKLASDVPTAITNARRAETEPQGAHDPAENELAPTEPPPGRAPAALEPTARVAAETALTPTPPWISPTLLAVGLLAVGALIGGGVFLATRDGPRAAPDPVVEPTPAEVRLQVRVSPADARLFLGGVEFPNPMDVPRPRSLEPVTLRVERDGYATVTRALVLDHDQSLDLTLAPSAPPEAPEDPAPQAVDDPPAEPTPTAHAAHGRRGRRGRASATEPPVEVEAPPEPPAENPTSGAEDGIYRGRRGGLRDEF